MSSVQGIDQLIRRLEAIGEPHPVLRAAQLATVEEAQKLVPRKTGFLQRNIKPGPITATHAQVIAETPYAAFVEIGTGLYGPKHQKIVPKKAKVLAWRVGATRLTGRSRISGGKELAGWAFAQSVKGRPKTPYLVPGAKKAIGHMREIIVKLWNSAA